jgi:hypothetical protein
MSEPNEVQPRKTETCECPCGCGGKAVYHLDAVADMPGQFTLTLGRDFLFEKDERGFRGILSAHMQEFGDGIMAAWRRRHEVRLMSLTAPNCPGCDVPYGSIHCSGCEVERCAACGGQRLTCGCEKHSPWGSRWLGYDAVRE